uniref:Innexin n=1 Tax=Ditylenchus dipsaci TaxID=166011 RepID=A0A915CNC5_9BILA
MLGIPFLSKYIQKVVKEQAVADSVDWLNYYCTSIMLAFFSLAISAKQYFGSPMKCWTPQDFKGGWQEYAENYCFIRTIHKTIDFQNSYFVPDDEEVPSDLELRADQISYYRWVPIVLACQALLFWLPNWLWNMLHKQTAVNPRSIVNEAVKSRSLAGAEREQEIKNLAYYIGDVLSVFQPSKKRIARSGLNATALYLGVKLAYALNAFGQLIMLNKFLGGEYFSWGYETMISVVNGEDWKESVVFPRVIMCDFVVRRLANPQRWSIQCVMMLNMINEKMYFFLYFWFIFVGLVTLINFFYYLIVLSIPFFRTKFVLLNINRHENKMRGMTTRDMEGFVQNYLRPDGVLLMQFIRQHIGGRVTYDLLNEMLRMYWNKQQNHSIKSSPTSEKTGRSNDVLYNDPQSPPTPNTYKSTMYGPAGLYPMSLENPMHASAPPKNDTLDRNLTSPADYIDSGDSQAGTLPIGDVKYNRQNGGHMASPARDPRSVSSRSPYLNQYQVMQSTPKRRGEQNTYYQVAVFKGDDATTQLQKWKENMDSVWNKDENKWHLKKKSHSEKHDVENFECNYSRRKNYGCLAVLRIRRIEGKQEIVVERAKSHSDHKPISKSARSFSTSVKKIVSERMQDKTPKKELICYLAF